MNEPGSGSRELGILYVSVSTLKLPADAGQVDAIVSWSQVRNGNLDVTGALVFTEKRFAQYLEGPAENLDEVIASIERDRRHRDIDFIYKRPLIGRRFPTWALAYAGPSTFVAGHVLAVADASGETARAKSAERLIEMMQQFVQAQLAEQRRQRGG